MGIFKKLFGGDPQRDLQKAEAFLAKGEAVRAVELAQKVAAVDDVQLSAAGTELLGQARTAAMSEALEKASVAETSEYFEDAAEWVRNAIEFADPTERSGLEARVEDLLEKARRAEQEELEKIRVTAPEYATELDSETHYLALIGMLREDVADRYERMPEAFRRAYVDLNEGRVEEALTLLEDLASQTEDPLVRFERGRCRLMSGDAEGALADLEAVRPQLGEEPLDLGAEISVPLSWAEAMLVLGRTEPVLEQLREMADPASGRPSLSYRYGQALLMGERFDDARRFLATAASTYPSNPVFPEQLAMALERLGERAAAIDCLEAAIAPSCAGGNCGKPRKHLPSIRSLAALYLADGEQPQRIFELMKHVVREQGGNLLSEDHALMARYHELVGDTEAAEESAAEAERLRQTGDVNLATASPSLGGQGRTPI